MLSKRNDGVSSRIARNVLINPVEADILIIYARSREEGLQREADGREVVKLDFTISHKLSARVSRSDRFEAMRRKAARREAQQREILIIPFTSRPTYPTSLSARNLIAPGKTISADNFSRLTFDPDTHPTDYPLYPPFFLTFHHVSIFSLTIQSFG